MNKIMVLLVMFLLVTITSSFAYEAEIYEKDDCIYIIGHLTNKEKAEDMRQYKERMTEWAKRLEIERQRKQEVEIETIKAQAMRDYLIAQGMPLREVADAIRRIKIEQNVVIEDITSNSSSSVGNTTSTASTGAITNTNSATGGSGGMSTHNDY